MKSKHRWLAWGRAKLDRLAGVPSTLRRVGRASSLRKFPTCQRGRRKLREWVTYVLEAASVQPRVLGALITSILVFVGLTGFWLFSAIAVAASNSIIAAAVALFFLTLLVSFPVSVPLFILIALPALRVRLITTGPNGTREEWVHPKYFREDNGSWIAPQWIWRIGREWVIHYTDWWDKDGNMIPMPVRRDHPLLSDVAVTEAGDKRADQVHFSAPQPANMQQRLNQALMFGVIIAALFVALAVFSDSNATQAAAEAAAQ